MKTKRKLTGRLVVLVWLMTIIFSTEVRAEESATISVSTPADTYLVGDNVTVNINLQASGSITGYDLVVTYNPAVLEFQSASGDGNGGGGEILFFARTESSQTLTFKAIGSGNTEIAVNAPIFGVGSDLEADHNNPSMSLTVSAPPTYSDNNYLSDLRVSAGNLSPAFDTNTFRYSCTVDANVDRLVVTATTQDSKAKTWVSDAALNYGVNNIAVVVTAENGEERRYQITCTRATPPQEQTPPAQTEPESKKVVVNDVIYNILTDYEEHPLPEGYSPKSTDIDGVSLEAGYSDTTKLTLVYLEMEGGGGTNGFYLYDTASKKFSLYVTAQQPARQYTILPITNTMEKPAGLVLAKAEIGGQQVDAMTDPDNKAYVVFYGVDEQGNAGWFRYCSADGTVQKYVADVKGEKPAETQSQREVLSGTLADLNNSEKAVWWRNVALLTGGIAIILLILLAILFRKMRGPRPQEALYGSQEEYESRGGYDPQEDDDSQEELLLTEEEYLEAQELEEERPAGKTEAPVKNTIVYPQRKPAREEMKPEKPAESEAQMEPEEEMEPEAQMEPEEELEPEEQMELEAQDDFEFLDFEEEKDNESK